MREGCRPCVYACVHCMRALPTSQNSNPSTCCCGALTGLAHAPRALLALYGPEAPLVLNFPRDHYTAELAARPRTGAWRSARGAQH
jgi:hypothetical protein